MKGSPVGTRIVIGGLLLGLLLTLGFGHATAQGSSAGLIPSQPSFSAGVPAMFKGRGFVPGEAVTFQVTHARGTPVSGPNHTPATVVADPAGGFVAIWPVCAGDCAGELLQIEATGRASGRVARATFMDLSAPPQPGTWVQTDKGDYAPGTTAHITAAGFKSGEAVTLQVHHADGTPDGGADHAPWVVFAGTDGKLATTWHVCEDDCLGSTLRVTASGQASGRTARAIFTDAVGSPTFDQVHSFGTPATGGYPYARLVQGTDGALYGTASLGGTVGAGTAFRLNPDGSGFTVLRNFDYTSGSYPYGGLVQGSDGALYGTTYYGGTGGAGTVFKLNTNGSGFTVLWSFDYASGAYPFSGLVQGTDGALYGTTYFGGSSGVGTVFKLNTDGSGFTVLLNFDNAAAGGYPNAGLIQGADGALYGTASNGGSSFYGTVFKLNTDGSGFTVLQSFDFSSGASPYGALVQGTDGAIYGTTLSGGSGGYGTVFKLNTDGSGFQTLQNLQYSATGGSPYAGLVQGTDGALYGTAAIGGSVGYGTVFKLNTDGSGFMVLRNLDYSTTGASPYAGLIQGTDGGLYGTAYQGGTDGSGTVFKLSTDGSGFMALRSLNYAPSLGADGGYPYSAPIQGADGGLYGTTVQGGAGGYGLVFRSNTDGSGFTVLTSFDYSTTGGYVYGGLVQGSDGALYGTATLGGSGGAGTVFKLNTNGSGFTVIRNFDYSGGAYPYGRLMQGTDGALYGTTQYGGSGGYGVVFKMNTDGSGFTVLKNFDFASGAYPYGGLIQGTDGALYGAAYYGGSGGYGVVFRMNMDGSGFVPLKSFDYSTTGGYVFSGVMQGADGGLYGTTNGGGSSGYGTAFRLNADGSGFALLQNFDYTTGAYPNGGLVQGADGALYGTAYYGGSGGYGTVFGMNTDGSDFTVLQSFDYGANGGYPYAGLTRGANGDLYGATYLGGDSGFGTVYRLIFNANRPPVARCRNVTVLAGAGCAAAASIDDGSSDPDGGDTITLTQSPAGPYALGTTNVTMTVTDNHGASSTCSGAVTVINPAPVATITGPASGSLWAVNTAVPFTGAWTDSNGGAHTTRWTFDGVPDAPFAVGSGTSGAANTSHTFTAAGVYMVQLTVTDSCGGAGSASQVGGVDAMVVVYDPTAGFVTGGGWITSPAGAYVANPSLSGKANFGFESKYKKGANMPTGETEFQYKVGNLNFHSTSYEWLVVSGAKAQFKGAGTINGAGSYGFILTCIDGNIPGGGGTDKLRMKITTSGGGLVYDNKLNAPDADDPTTVLGGGSIVIHPTGGNAAAAGESREEAGALAASLPVEYGLSQNRPNPFAERTELAFSLPERSRIRLAVFDVAGREVRSLADGDWEPGWHSATLDRTGGDGGRLGAGMYFVRMSAQSLASGRSFTSMKRIVLVE